MSNKVAPSPLYDILQQLKTEVFKDLRVCLPASISGVSAATGTVSVKIGVMQKAAQVGLPTGLDFFYPELTGCPVFTPQGGGVGVVMPVKVGDGCLVVFSDRCIGAWFTTGQANPLPSVRLHDISDGFVLVGLNPQTSPLLTPLEDFEGGIAETANAEGAKVVVNAETHLVSIKNAAQDLATILTGLTTTLTTLNAPTGNGSVIGVMAQLTAIVATLNTAIAVMTTASIASGVPQAVAAGQETTLTALAASMTALSAAAIADLAVTATAVPELLY